MKKIVAIVLLAALLMFAGAQAQEGVPSISDNLFSAAKEALSLLSYGEFARVAEVLPFSGAAPDAEEWSKFAQSFSTLNSGTVQREISVAFWTGSAWYLAVPVSEPNNGAVETLVLRSDDGASFCGYKCADWASVQSGYENSAYVQWNREYVAGTPVVIAD